MASFISQIIILPLLLLFFLSPQCGSAHTVHVAITNELGDGKNLTVHCKSKNDDIGIHVLLDSDSFGWHFKPNIWGTTCFYCYLYWDGGQAERVDVYSAYLNCQKNCSWSATQIQGICLGTPDLKGYPPNCYKWNSTS